MNNGATLLNAAHNEQLLELAQCCDSGSSWFQIDRSPDWFALANYLGKSTYFGVFRDGKLVGCAGIAQQLRLIRSEIQTCHYLHDVKVHPSYRRSTVFLQLIRSIQQHFPHDTLQIMATILDQNPYRDRLLSINWQRFKLFKLSMGRTIHMGIPTFIGSSTDELTGIEVVAPQEAWNYYLAFTSDRSFAPMDREAFQTTPGLFLIRKKGKEVVSTCKIMDQTTARRIVSTKKLTLPLYTVNLVNRMRRRSYPALPSHGEIFHHGYLAYYATNNGIDDRPNYLAYFTKLTKQPYSYLFLGLSPTEAQRYRRMFAFSFASSTYLFSPQHEEIPFDFHELTLI